MEEEPPLSDSAAVSEAVAAMEQLEQEQHGQEAEAEASPEEEGGEEPRGQEEADEKEALGDEDEPMREEEEGEPDDGGEEEEDEDEGQEEEEGEGSMKPEPGEGDEEVEYRADQKGRTRGSLGIKRPKKEWTPAVKAKKYKIRPGVKRRPGRPRLEDYVTDSEEDDEDEEGRGDAKGDYIWDVDRVKAEGDDEDDDDDDYAEDADEAAAVKREEDEDAEADDDLDFKPQWERCGEQVVPKRYRRGPPKATRGGRRRGRPRGRRRGGGSGYVNQEQVDRRMEARARRQGLGNLQCPSCGFRSPLVQFIKRHWISTHSTSARQKLLRKESYARRKQERELQSADQQTVKVRGYATHGDDDGYPMSQEEGLELEAAFFRTVEFTDDPAKPFRCDKCPFRAAKQTGIKQHYQKVHAVKKEVKVSQLTEEERELITLVILLDTQGKVVETYRCKHCEFQSAQKEDTLAHANSQLCKGDGKTFKCKKDKCQYKANSKNQLRGHVNFQHGGLGF